MQCTKRSKKMKKILSLLLVLTLLVTLFVGCGKEDDAATDTTPDATPDAAADGDDVDAVTTASIVDNGDAVVAGLSADGTWIVATLNDISTDKEIVVDGLFYNKDW
jgi:hypothetical protein